jgi:two-component system, chemotaxis family, protein-glutamate methylesterase/glutaminase
MTTASPRLSVLVVDDSAVVRQTVKALLAGADGLSVDVAADPIIAMSKMARARPDVLLLDLEMPRMDGLSFLRRIMATDPLPVVVCSGLVGHGTEAALQALEEGAVGLVAKPRLGVRDFLQESARALEDTLRGAAAARLVPRRRRRAADATPDGHRRSRAPRLALTTDKVVAVGASTGGTEALREILEGLPPDCPGLVIVQHMPEVFTRAFADRLDKTCAIRVKEAEDGDRLLRGRALVAPGNRHTTVVRDGAHYSVRVTDGPLSGGHRPSVDVLFRSVASAAGPNAVGVILTGMGADGADGLRAMKDRGAPTIAQDEATCVVFGMPKEAIARGAVDDVVALPRIASALLRKAQALPRALPRTAPASS